MSTRLYVGNLSFNATADSVRTAFQEFGTVTDVHLVSDRETGRSRGFGFVGFLDAGEGATAQQAMDGSSLDGRTIRVNEAEDKAGGPRGGARRP